MAKNISFDGHAFDTMKTPEPTRVDVPNTTWKKTVGGKDRAVKFGDSVRRRSYMIYLDCAGSPDDETTWDAFIVTLSGYSLTFTFVDHREESFTARFLAPPKKITDEVDDVLIPVEIIEVLT